MSMADVVTTLRAAGCVFAEDEARMLVCAADSPASLAGMVERRAGGEPLEQVVGFAEFCGLRIAVEPGVFLPRRRTEFLTRLAAARARAGDVVLDLCCGAGAIGAAVVAMAPGPIELHASDIDATAVRCARGNLGPDAHVYQGDLFEPLPGELRGRIRILTVNVPYVPTEAIRLLPPEARDYEPGFTLDGGADGLDVLRRVADEAPLWLTQGGALLTETSERQSSTAAEILSHAGLTPSIDADDEIGATVVIGRLP
jgi:release factor glutamine methyltransferase